MSALAVPESEEPNRIEHLVDSARAAALHHLWELRKVNGRVPGDVMASTAAQIGVSVEHLRRMVREYGKSGRIRNKPPGNPHKIELPDVWKAQVAYFVANGNAAAAYWDLKHKSLLPDQIDLRTFQRRVNEWDPAFRACAKGGYRAMVKHQFFNVEHIPYRGYAYGTDHTFLPIQVLPNRGSTKPVWPWLTTVMDLKTRLVLAYLLTLHTPNAVDSLNTLIEAIHGRFTDDGDFIGGRPEFIRSDRGGDFIEKALSLNLIHLEIERQFTEPYSSWQNGRVERLNGTIETEFAPSVPGFHPGGEAEYTRRVFKTPLPVTSHITVDALDDRLRAFFDKKNTRPHTALKGMTPMEAWLADTHPVDRANRGILLHAMSSRGTRRLNRYGIEIRGHIYSHPTLARLLRQNVTQVEVRYHEHDKDHIEVFVDGVHQCTAVETRVQPAWHKFGVLSVRDKQRREAEAAHRQADYDRVLAERERCRELHIDESEWPPLPELPEESSEAADRDNARKNWSRLNDHEWHQAIEDREAADAQVRDESHEGDEESHGADGDQSLTGAERDDETDEDEGEDGDHPFEHLTIDDPEDGAA